MEILDRLLRRETAAQTSCTLHGPGECYEGCPHSYAEFDPEPTTEILLKVPVMIKVAEDHEGYSVVCVPKKGQEIVLCSILAGDMIASVDYAATKLCREWNDSTDDYEHAAEYLAKRVRDRLAAYGLYCIDSPDDMLWEALLTITMPGPGIAPPAVTFVSSGFRTEI